MDEIIEEINLKLSELGFDPSFYSPSSSSSDPLSSSFIHECESEQDFEVLSWLNDSMGIIIEDSNSQNEVADEFNDDDDDYYESCEIETILEERLQQLSLQYEALSKTDEPPVRMSEDKYRRTRKEKSLQCQEAARNFGDAVQSFLATIKEFRPTDMNDKQIKEYFTREEEFTRGIREWVHSKLEDMPHEREDDLASRQATLTLLNRTLTSTEKKLLESEIKISEEQSTDDNTSEKDLADAKSELENLTEKVIPVLCEGYELLETLPAVVADWEEEIEEMAYSAAVLEQGISFMMEQLSRCFLFELLLEEKALRGDMQVSIITHVMEKELLVSKMEYEQWKAKNAQGSRKTVLHGKSDALSGSRVSADEKTTIEGLTPSEEYDAIISSFIQNETEIENSTSKESIVSYGRLRPWVQKLEGMLFDESGKLSVKQDGLEGILSEAEAKTKELNNLVAQLERNYHTEKDSIKCDRIRSFERNLWIDFFANPEKLKEIVREAQNALLN